jgi:hypothetical protein
MMAKAEKIMDALDCEHAKSYQRKSSIETHYDRYHLLEFTLVIHANSRGEGEVRVCRGITRTFDVELFNLLYVNVTLFE